MAPLLQGGNGAVPEEPGVRQSRGKRRESRHRRAGLDDEGPADRRGHKGEGRRRASKKRYTAKGGGAEKEFFSLDGASLK